MALHFEIRRCVITSAMWTKLSSRGIVRARIMMTNPNTMVVMRRHPPYHLALMRGLDPHYGVVTTALATSSLQNYLQALHPHAQRPRRKVSALSGRHCAAYLLQSDALRPALSLSLRQTATPHLCCAPSSESGLFPSPAQRQGNLSLQNYAPSLTQVF